MDGIIYLISLVQTILNLKRKDLPIGGKKEKMKRFFYVAVEVLCKFLAVLLVVAFCTCLVTGVAGLIDCITGGTTFTYLGAIILIAISVIIVFVLTHMPERFYDNIEY